MNSTNHGTLVVMLWRISFGNMGASQLHAMAVTNTLGISFQVDINGRVSPSLGLCFDLSYYVAKNINLEIDAWPDTYILK